ncbi:MAG TPA: rhodanese-like domain-containing protein [Dokdonella sp.]|uniref:rhodanese-like domain-containing protein n=1 Tax=Dokdonella sp. TaxID=2291710 RepID=UPI002BBA8935|nr:rhodanese-like domain-containing protein [Dokdonella sp.]HUD42259.1 rhodanese-like domain-containing protein [Dokdonella sp.]
MRGLTAVMTVVMSVAAVFGAPGPSAAAEKTISAEALAARLDGPAPPTVLDVRSAEEFGEGRLPGALTIPHDQVPARLGELGAPREIVLYCRSGRRARLAGASLEAAGFDVAYLEGDYPGWAAEGRSVERGAAPGPGGR